jgi:hypothetical protein
MESQIQLAESRGRLMLWKFSPDHRSYTGWNLAADEERCLSLGELLEGMHASRIPTDQTLAIEPADIGIIKAATGSKPYKTINRLTLRYRKGEPQLWVSEEAGDELLLSFGEREIELLQTALYRVLKGESDFAIGDANDQHLLYFWGFLEAE